MNENKPTAILKTTTDIKSQDLTFNEQILSELKDLKKAFYQQPSNSRVILPITGNGTQSFIQSSTFSPINNAVVGANPAVNIPAFLPAVKNLKIDKIDFLRFNYNVDLFRNNSSITVSPVNTLTLPCYLNFGLFNRGYYQNTVEIGVAAMDFETWVNIYIGDLVITPNLLPSLITIEFQQKSSFINLSDTISDRLKVAVLGDISGSLDFPDFTSNKEKITLAQYNLILNSGVLLDFGIYTDTSNITDSDDLDFINTYLPFYFVWKLSYNFIYSGLLTN